MINFILRIINICITVLVAICLFVILCVFATTLLPCIIISAIVILFSKNDTKYE